MDKMLICESNYWIYYLNIIVNNYLYQGLLVQCEHLKLMNELKYDVINKEGLFN